MSIEAVIERDAFIHVCIQTRAVSTRLGAHGELTQQGTYVAYALCTFIVLICVVPSEPARSAVLMSSKAQHETELKSDDFISGPIIVDISRLMS